MPTWLNRAKMSVSGSPGTGTVTLGAAVTPYQSFAAAGAQNGATYSYVIEEGGTKFECGHGTYTSSGTTFSRDTVFDSSAGFGTKESFTSNAVIYMAPLTQDTYTAGKNSFFIPSSAMVARLTNPPTRSQIETATNKLNVLAWDFDQTTQQFLQFGMKMPKSWDHGTITFVPVWRHPSASTNFNVVWGLQAVALRDAVGLDQAFGTAQEVADTGGSADTLYVGAESSAITIAGSPQAGDYVQFQAYRKTSGVTGNLAAAATLVGMMIFMTTIAENDA